MEASRESLSSLQALRAEQARLKSEYERMEVRVANCVEDIVLLIKKCGSCRPPSRLVIRNCGRRDSASCQPDSSFAPLLRILFIFIPTCTLSGRRVSPMRMENF